ncbi:MAG: hypothetical protein LC746_17185 [Acidobacteria bacterium]|nr:hypothetical protein [Acidobacteriota bacterium]
MYKPNFCCDCGERVLRERWRAWTSRRHCAACESRHRRVWIAPLFTACALAAAGFAAGRLMRPAPPPLVLARGALPLPALVAKGATYTTQTATGAGAPRSGETTDGSSQRGGATTSNGADGSASNSNPTPAGLGFPASEPPTDPNEVISICGARTKKGTPCQRRVRGTGRCWQHTGMPAMIPLEKRILQGTP